MDGAGPSTPGREWAYAGRGPSRLTGYRAAQLATRARPRSEGWRGAAAITVGFPWITLAALWITSLASRLQAFGPLHDGDVGTMDLPVMRDLAVLAALVICLVLAQVGLILTRD